jgi:murein DD-endopeptidase MepM/ murein hydrolase activator NlpD
MPLLLANDTIKLYFHDNSVNNAHTALLYLEGKDIHEPKLTFEQLNIDFLKHPKKNNTYFALIPIDYYIKPKTYRVITSYKNNDDKKMFKGIELTVNEGNYKSEILKVQSSKINLSDEDKKRTQEEYDEAMNIYNTSSDYLITSFIHPMQSPITSEFGNKRVYNNTLQSFHSGTDFKASVGTPIYASAQGVVKIAKNRFYAGNSVVLDHGYGVYSCYYHLDSLNVQEGQTVSQNELLGYSGSTGRVTGPHLHFTIRVKNVIVDPIQFIKIINILE